MSLFDMMRAREHTIGTCCFLAPRCFYSLGQNDSAEVAIKWLFERLETMGFATPHSKWNAVKTYRLGGKIQESSGWVKVRYDVRWDYFVESLKERKFDCIEDALETVKKEFPEYPWRSVPPEILMPFVPTITQDIYATILDEKIWRLFLHPRLEVIRNKTGGRTLSLFQYEFHEGFHPQNGIHIMDFTDGIDNISEKNTVNRKWGILVEYLTHTMPDKF